MEYLIHELFLPVILYAETHYRFKGIYSRLFKKEPEIVADAPHRVEPGQPIPILLLIKDAHRFPVELIAVRIKLRNEKISWIEHTFHFHRQIKDDRFWFEVIYVEQPREMTGWVQVDVEFNIKVNGKIKVYHNDNYRISSRQPLTIFLADDPLPRLENWYFGDFHYHSSYTEDQVEFGAPLEATVQLAKAMGLNFYAVTDHSYDLDDCKNSWLQNDPQIPKWHTMQEEVASINRSLSDFVVLPGEEVSAGNSEGKNVHLLVVNNRKFFPGKGDSAERWLHTKPDLAITEILDQLEQGAIAVAAHPEIPVPFLQKLLIRRGKWQWDDYLHPALHGFQIWNGERDESFFDGSPRWAKLLLAGKKLSLIAGNDAHGNFNKFRQIGFPFFTFRELPSQIFGKMRTAVNLAEDLTVDNVLKAVKKGHTLVTDGPVVEFSVRNERGERAAIGDTVQGVTFEIIVRAKSSAEFGKLSELKIICGDLQKNMETTWISVEQFEHPYDLSLNQSLPSLLGNSYLRAELIAKQADGKMTKCLTNPIWIKKIP